MTTPHGRRRVTHWEDNRCNIMTFAPECMRQSGNEVGQPGDESAMVVLDNVASEAWRASTQHRGRGYTKAADLAIIIPLNVQVIS